MIVSLVVLAVALAVLLFSARLYSRSDVEKSWKRWTLILGIPANALAALAVTANRGGIVGIAGGLFTLAGILYASHQRWKGREYWRQRVAEKLRGNPRMKEAFQRNRIFRHAMPRLDDDVPEPSDSSPIDSPTDR